MFKIDYKLVFILLALVQLFSILNAETVESNETDDIEDYSWDYDETSEVKPPLSKKEILSLNRDWLGREDPDKYPSHGFFPVWGACLIVMSVFFHVMAIIFGLLHVLGCKGKRPREPKTIDAKQRKMSLAPPHRKLSVTIEH
ncbi:unnamed protein product [Brachionus calyciflorus]|uniref:Uncharacterized protein n=1 Tax=Brachionus calyciflorus TaxID=104777 RepID=A0A813TGY9_9BILA|nr:unnamed protein product [Brachionus calyciflorus]